MRVKKVHHDFRRRILREVKSDPSTIPVTSLASEATNAITPAEAVIQQLVLATGSQQTSAVGKHRTSTIDVQTTLLLKLLQNKQSARQLVALYLALASEVSASSERNNRSTIMTYK